MKNNRIQLVKVKNPKKEFLCALCSSPRQMRYSKNLSKANYLQILVSSAFSTWALFPLIGMSSLLSAPFIWMAFEVTNKFLYRKEITCPYCGFDATWYRRDVKLARKKVEEFWASRAQKPTLSDVSSPNGATKA